MRRYIVKTTLSTKEGTVDSPTEFMTNISYITARTKNSAIRIAVNRKEFENFVCGEIECRKVSNKVFSLIMQHNEFAKGE